MVERFVVLRQEQVSVPAGSFDAFVVEQRERVAGASAYEAARKYWFAPEVGTVVKSSFAVVSLGRTVVATWSGTTLVPGDYEAVKISVPPK